MKYRKLGNTELKVSVIGIGTDQFSGSWNKHFTNTEVTKILNHGEKLGINFIDTAECYGDHTSESLIGESIKNSRDHWIIGTKFGHQYNDHRNIRNVDFNPKSVISQFEKSLKSLKTDYVDVYQFHSGTNEEFFQNELWDVLNELVKSGKIKHLGVSIVNSVILSNDYQQLKNSKNYNCEVIEVVYNRLNRKVEETVLPYCLKNGLGVIARVPLAKGHLSGKYLPNYQFPNKDIRSTHDKDQTKSQLEKVKQIRKNEVPSGVNLAQWSLSWCLKHESISCVIPGCKNLEQLEINANAVNINIFPKNHPLDCIVD
jgi:aryl-alcohol dehydrogenase-like predicted oxidoreductase